MVMPKTCTKCGRPPSTVCGLSGCPHWRPNEDMLPLYAVGRAEPVAYVRRHPKDRP